jgi:hypothetical protein
MPRDQRTITSADILTLDQYEVIRADKRQESLLRKTLTRVHVGPNATAIFETWDSMWLQIQEMLRIEKGGAEQLVDEIAFEVEDPVRRDQFLRKIGGVEDHVAIQLGPDRIAARPEGDVQRTRESDGKASAVHFFHFDFTPAQIAAWVSGNGQAMLVIDHPEYGHAALFSADTRAFLARECFAAI